MCLQRISWTRHRILALNAAPALPTDPTNGLPSYQFPGVTAAQSGLAFPLSSGIILGRLFLGLVNNNSGPGVQEQTTELQ